VIAGLGNIYRAETLFAAGISPLRLVSSLTDGDLLRISVCATTVLRIAYVNEGAMEYEGWFLSMYNPILRGKISTARRFSRSLVYGQSLDVMGNLIRRDVMAGRTMWWSPALQS
jgi:formamidopyrimidine-DNA glycosylase